jgi:hypothetical protein
MKLEITNHFAPNGTEFFYWKLFDGTENIDEVSGFGSDLIEVFSKVIEWRERISRDYIDNETN